MNRLPDQLAQYIGHTLEIERTVYSVSLHINIKHTGTVLYTVVCCPHLCDCDVLVLVFVLVFVFVLGSRCVCTRTTE